METVRERTDIFTFRVPRKDHAMVRTMAKRLGWETITEPRKHASIDRREKCGLDLALEEARKGDINYYNSAEELFVKLGI